jgi:serine/threonine-protein kinase
VIRLDALGAVRLQRPDGQSVDEVLAQPRRLALLVVLALAGPGASLRRDQLLLLFWPDSDTAHARNALSRAIYVLRHALGAGVLVSRGTEEVGIDRARLVLDAAGFEALAKGGRHREALALYRGDLLEGFHIANAPDFERWLDQERHRLRDLAAQAAWNLAERDEAGGTDVERVALVHRAVQLSQGDEPGVRRGMRLLARLGDRRGALALCERFTTRLRDELSATPAAETLRLAAELRRPVAAASEVPAAEPVPTEVAVRALPGEGATPARRARRRRFVTSLALAAGVVVVAALAGSQRERAVLDGDLVGILPFTLPIADSSLDAWREGVPRMLSGALDGAGPIRTLPAAVLLDRAGGFEGAERAALAARLGAGLVIEGELVAAGADSVRLVARILEAGSGTSIGEREVRERRDRLDRATDSLAVRLLHLLGRGRAIAAVRGASLGANSLPALKVFLRGEQHYRHGAWDSALASYQEAIHLDSTFALALRRAGRTGFLLLAPIDFTGLALRAGAANHGLPARESLLVAVDSNVAVALRRFPGTVLPAGPFMLRAHELARRAAESNPLDPEALYVLYETRALVSGLRPLDRAEQAALGERILALDSGFVPLYQWSVSGALRDGKVARARVLAAGAARNAPRTEVAGVMRTLEALLGAQDSTSRTRVIADVPLMAQMALWDATRRWPDAPAVSLALARSIAGTAPTSNTLLAHTLAYRGRVREAWALARGAEMRRRSRSLLLALAAFGVVPAESLDAALARAFESGRPEEFAPHLPRLAEIGDTAAVLCILQDVRAMDREGAAPEARAVAAHYLDVTEVHLAIARRDTIAALGLLPRVTGEACAVACAESRLAHLRLLRERRRWPEAVALAGLEVRLWSTEWPDPIEVQWEFERAQVFEATGSLDRARAAYDAVAGLWAHADAPLSGVAAQSRAAAARLKDVDATKTGR